jgi:acyl carrier protein phosphodiesterase
MNCLAHLYLSGNDPDLKIGNFMADHIKGKAMNNYPANIRNGILLHRKIDFFTDHHPVVQQSKISLRPKFHKYAPVITDIFYDHFLAKNWDHYSTQPLKEYADEFYSLAAQYTGILPLRTQNMLRYMTAHNWLVSYASLDGIHKVLTGMSKRTAFDSGMEKAAQALRERYVEFESEFTVFFDELIRYVKKVMQEDFPVSP